MGRVERRTKTIFGRQISQRDGESAALSDPTYGGQRIPGSIEILNHGPQCRAVTSEYYFEVARVSLRRVVGWTVYASLARVGASVWFLL
jgi:hypothetical protein